jgi:hypothetical protein
MIPLTQNVQYRQRYKNNKKKMSRWLKLRVWGVNANSIGFTLGVMKMLVCGDGYRAL